MPTYSFTRTREQFRDLVLRKLQVIGVGEPASADDTQIVYEAMDLRIKELHSLNLLWFKVNSAQVDVSLTSGSATVNAESDVLYPVTFAVRVNSEDVPIEIVDHRTYQAIPNKTDSGQPQKVLFEGGVYRFWPVPDADYTAKLTYQQIAADTADSTAPDVQVSMMRCLRSIVAYDLVDDFGVPEGRVARMKFEADEAMRTIRALNQPRADAATVEIEAF